MQIPQLVPLQTHFTGSAQYFLLQRDWQCNFFVVHSYLEKWMRKSPDCWLFGLIWSCILDWLKSKVFCCLCVVLAHIAYCYFWQLHSKMSSKNSCKSNIQYAAIVNLFIFNFQPFCSESIFCMPCTAQTHAHSVEFLAVWVTKRWEGNYLGAPKPCGFPQQLK